MSLLARAVIALVLTVVFYVFATAFALALIAAPVLRLVTGHSFPIFLGLAMVVSGVSILASLVPPREPFVDPGPPMTRERQPELLGLVQQVADEVGHPMPDDTYLVADANAGVAEDGRLFGDTRRVLILGLPLLELLSVDQLQAVLAHEFGHYVGGDTRIGRWTYRTREAIVRTLSALRDDDGKDGWFDKVVRAPFELYARVFLRITAAVSRREEFAADALAARVAGRDAQVGALRRIAAGAPAFDAYWHDEVVPALANGVRPPLGEGFRRFLSSGAIDRAVQEMLSTRLEQDGPDPYDSHPTLRQRLAELGAGPHEDPQSAGPPAATLLHDYDALERELVMALGGSDAAELRAAGWDEVETVWREFYESMVAEFRGVLAGRRLADVPGLAADVTPLAHDVRTANPDIPDDLEARGLATTLLGAATALALVREGFAFAARVGEPVACTRGDHRFEPFADLAQIEAGDADAAELRARLEAAGVTDAPLAPPAVTAGAGDAEVADAPPA